MFERNVVPERQMEGLLNKIMQLMGNAVFILLARIKTTLSVVKVYKRPTVFQKLLLGQSTENVGNIIFVYINKVIHLLLAT